MSIFGHLRHTVPTTTLVSNSEFEFEAESFESTVPEGMFREQEFGAAMVFDRAGLSKRAALAGYRTYDAALKAIQAIVRGAGLRPLKLGQSEPALNNTASSSSFVSRSGASLSNWNSSIRGIISSATTITTSTSGAYGTPHGNVGHGAGAGLGHAPGHCYGHSHGHNHGLNHRWNSANTFFFAGTADALQLAMNRLRLAGWLRHAPGRTDVGRFYAIYPRGPDVAKYVAQDAVFNEV